MRKLLSMNDDTQIRNDMVSDIPVDYIYWQASIDLQLTSEMDSWVAYTGISPESLTQDNWLQLFHSFEHMKIARLFQKAAQLQTPQEIIAHIITPSQKYNAVIFRVYPQYADEQCIGFCGRLFDVSTSFPQLYSEMFEPFAKDVNLRTIVPPSFIQSLVDGIELGVIMYDHLGSIHYINKEFKKILKIDMLPGFEKMTLFERGDMLNIRDINGVVLPHQEWPWVKGIRGEKISGKEQSDLVILRNFIGNDVILNLYGGPVVEANGDIIGAIMFMSDITQKKLDEKRLQNSFNAFVQVANYIETAEIIPAPADTSEDGNLIIRHVLEIIRNTLGFSVIGVAAFKQGKFMPVYIAGLDPIRERKWIQSTQDHDITELFAPEYIDQIMQGKQFIFHSPKFRQAPQTIVSPIVMNRETVGVLGITSSNESVTENELFMAKTAAHLTGIFFEWRRLRREYEESIAQEQALRATNEQLDSFISIASHEIRTPAALVKGNSQLAVRRIQRFFTDHAATMSEESRNFVFTMIDMLKQTDEYIDRLNRLVGDMLDITYIDRKQIQFRLEETDVAQIIRIVAQELMTIHNSYSVHVEIPENIDFMALIDIDRIRQVVTIFLENAFKFSGNTHDVIIRLTLAATHRIHCEVADHGPGIPAEDMERIWTKFQKAQNTPIINGSQTGMGLGLFLAKSFISELNGDIGVISQRGRGSTFWFSLPALRK